MQYICSKTGDEGSIYAARQGMRACNNNNMRNPIISREGLRMLLLLHALIPCLAAYILPSSPVLCIYTALVSLLFGTLIPTSFNILMKMFLLPCFTGFCCILACKYNALCVYASPTHFAARGYEVCTCVITRKWRSTTRKC